MDFEYSRLIPVSERLPEIKRDVLVYLKNGRFFVAALFAEPFPDATGQCYRWIGEEEISFRFCDVEAWMELPERKDDYECTKAHEMIEDRLHCRRCGDRVITGEWDDYNYCPKCGKKAKVYETGWR